MSLANKALRYVVIVGAGPLVFPAYKIAREDLGLGIIAIDWAQDAMGMKYADIPITVSTKDVPEVVNKVLELSRDYDIRGAFTCGADVEATVAAITETLSLPGISLEVAQRCNNKILMHQHLDAIGYKEKAPYRIVDNIKDAIKATLEIGLPCVIKPIANCASRGVQRIKEVDQVAGAFQLAKEYSDTPNESVLIEQALDGSKHTVEMIAWSGERHLLSIIDTHYISNQWPCESNLNTTLLSKEIQTRLFDTAGHVAELMGIDFGAHKVDINLDSAGNIKVIELTARLSGGFHCQYASPLAFGSNDIRAALKLAIGLPLDREDIHHKYQRGSAVLSLFPQPGCIKQILGVDRAKKITGVSDIILWKSKGDIVGPYYNSADRFAYVITHADTTEMAMQIAENAVNQIAIKTEPVT